MLDAAKYLRARNLRTVRVGRDMPGSNWHMHQLDVMFAFDTTLPRAVALAHDVLRVLLTLGLGARPARLLDPWGHQGHEFLLESADGERLVETRYSLDSPSGYPQMSGFSQPDLELVLEDRVNAVAAINQRRGVTVRSLRVVGDGVHGLAVDRDGTEKTVSARYVVGCDGANSTVRDLIGAPVTDLRFDRAWLVVDVVPHGPLPSSMRHAGQHLDPARPTTFVPAGPNRRRFEFMIMPGDDAGLLDTDAGAWALLQRSLIAESVEAALRRAHAPAHHRTEIAPPCRTITRL